VVALPLAVCRLTHQRDIAVGVVAYVGNGKITAAVLDAKLYQLPLAVVGAYAVTVGFACCILHHYLSRPIHDVAARQIVVLDDCRHIIAGGVGATCIGVLRHVAIVVVLVVLLMYHTHAASPFIVGCLLIGYMRILYLVQPQPLHRNYRPHCIRIVLLYIHMPACIRDDKKKKFKFLYWSQFYIIIHLENNIMYKYNK